MLNVKHIQYLSVDIHWVDVSQTGTDPLPVSYHRLTQLRGVKVHGETL